MISFDSIFCPLSNSNGKFCLYSGYPYTSCSKNQLKKLYVKGGKNILFPPQTTIHDKKQRKRFTLSRQIIIRVKG